MSYYKNLITLAYQGKSSAIREIVQYYINSNDPKEAEYWMKKLGQNEEEKIMEFEWVADDSD